MRLLVPVVAYLVLLGCSKPATKETPASGASDGDLFVWLRPKTTIPISLPIAQSTTCSFKKGLSASFMKIVPPDGPIVPERIYYSTSDENETDTVSFVDLDTNSPKVRSNNGQASLKVIYRDENMLTLGHTALNVFESYTIFTKKGVVIMSQHQNEAIIGPFGVMEMGYCN
jgi:hypothetical protein